MPEPSGMITVLNIGRPSAIIRSRVVKPRKVLPSRPAREPSFPSSILITLSGLLSNVGQASYAADKSACILNCRILDEDACSSAGTVPLDTPRMTRLEVLRSLRCCLCCLLLAPIPPSILLAIAPTCAALKWVWDELIAEAMARLLRGVSCVVRGRPRSGTGSRSPLLRHLHSRRWSA